ncbi:hypothetical protein PA25_20110 [Pseudoalteromonas sp. A25]|uniref:acetoacetate decarboxylase family protein n=1 Tax=Pseudoalteromonas sp. A25 TaxID=116092 RepID=UPI00129EFE5A|nr:acetoacetate decarboxylase family protein [Pseudoalteromonas sp. A25]BBN82026.1 hypothetical protein PA25_20110 [Pseudoalteromonas sp. A25]
MQPNYQIAPSLLDNRSQFSSPFFNRFELRHASSPLKLNEQVSKNYLFPTLYGDVSCAIAVFLCDYKRAQALLPHPKMKPVAMPRGRALVTFSCYQYKRVLGLAPYNEIAMTIPVMVDPLVNVPVLPMLMQSLDKFGYYVFHMPVTSEENRIRGREIWGLPKEVETVEIQTDNHYCTSRAIDAKGDHYLTLKVPTQGKAQHFDVASNLYSRLGTKLLQSPTHFKGGFNVNKNISRLWQKGEDDPKFLILGHGPKAQMLRELEIEPQPLETRYTAHMDACFDLANSNFVAPFAFSDER